jgi:glycerol-3-phosphate dehydrogenase
MKLRETNLARLGQETFDVCVVGGGINGAVSAASLAARGVRVALVDRGDFAGVTSQESSNLAWGGIKYMESFELGLVRKLCLARNRLIVAYPSTVRPIGFFMTHPRTFRRSRLLVWLGAWLYWLLGSCFTKTPRLLGTRQIAEEEPIVDTSGADGGVEYFDSHLHDNDARFVWNFIRSALNWGAIVANYVEIERGARDGDAYRLEARDVVSGQPLTVRARVVVNACGPYADQLNGRLGVETQHEHVLSKGVHLLVRRLSASWRVLTFFADDGRLFFMIPMGPCTCIGTTDTPTKTVPRRATAEDRAFILDNINRRLRLDAPLTERDIVAVRCGARPLAVRRPRAVTHRDGRKDVPQKDWMQLSRKHVIETVGAVVTVFGGKLTDCLNVGEEIFEHVARLGVRAPFPDRVWYGEPPDSVRDEFFHQARLMKLDAMTSASAQEPLSTRLWRRYGAEAIVLIESIRRDPRNAEVLIENAEYLRCEIVEAARREMVVRLDDFLRRRSKIAQVVPLDKLRSAAGLEEACDILFGSEAKAKLDEYFADVAASPHDASA